MRIKITVILILSLIAGASYGAPTIKKVAKTILYVGYSPSKEKPKYNERQSGFYKEEFFNAEITTRMNEFKSLLEQYFTSVTTVDVRDYKQEMSEDFDVTIFDALPEPITKAKDLFDEKGKYVRTLQPTYLDKDFHSPALFIGHTGGVMCGSLGVNIDWYCLCLNAHAHSTNFKHTIFHSPFKTSISKETRETPKQALSYMSGHSLPDRMDMWRVQKHGYREGKQYRIGLVSTGLGFKEGYDSEYISGGESLKSIDAAAIARHANFFLWGFAAAPCEMTDEAKIVFVNSVAYISGFGESEVKIRKRDEVNTSRSYVDDLLFVLSKKCKIKDEEFYKKRLTAELYEIYSEDPAKCYDYVKSNKQYFYGYRTYETFVIDADAKELGVANNDIRLIEKAITLLEKNEKMELAKRVLNRYTTESFDSAEQWRKWYDENHRNMFFSENAGYRFVVKSIKYEETSVKKSDNPVVITVSTEVRGGSKFLKIKFAIQADYQIYAMNENDHSPFHPTKVLFNHVDALQLKGEIIKPQAILYDKEGEIYVYKGEFEFVQEFQGDVDEISGTISYQCCNSSICMSPTTFSFNAKVKNK